MLHNICKLNDEKIYLKIYLLKSISTTSEFTIIFLFLRWCNPCRMLTPRIESVIAEKQGKILLAKVDIDENSELALDYEVC